MSDFYCELFPYSGHVCFAHANQIVFLRPGLCVYCRTSKPLLKVLWYFPLPCVQACLFDTGTPDSPCEPLDTGARRRALASRHLQVAASALAVRSDRSLAPNQPMPSQCLSKSLTLFHANILVCFDVALLRLCG